MREALRHVATGRGRSQTSEPHSTVVYVICGTGPDAARLARTEVEFWKLDPADGRAVHGSAEEIAAGARRWIDAGADTIVFQPHPDADLDEFIDVIGAARPLIVGSS
jgi:alkanesulfonate monooxygenase SsuD/methylene tetrahydromethanopterin reductase-like flavin-dependent oxidoreductase (luciferase family)